MANQNILLKGNCMNIFVVFYFLSIILIIFPFFIYPLSLKVINLFFVTEDLVYVEDNDLPKITLIITAYNEEKVIIRKLEESLNYEYPKEKLDIIVVSDDSTDSTNKLVKEFIENKIIAESYPKVNLIIVKGRKGKTVAQNIAVKHAEGEIVAFSDANSMWDKHAIRYMASRFIKENVGYVCGKLEYINTEADATSRAEGIYWNFDLSIRMLESNIASIVGGNGAIYAIRKKLYVDLPPLLSHDGFMPTKMVLKEATAKYEERAVAFEKASENSDDEFNRKVRMQRGQPWKKYTDIQKFNIFKYGWFSYFYFGHKYVKYLLYILHPTLFISNLFIMRFNIVYKITFFMQLIFLVLAILGYILKDTKKIKLFYFPYHYALTILAQLCAVINTLKGNNKATWEISKTTR